MEMRFKVAAVTGSDSRLSRVVSVLHNKGGAGKTTVTANLGGEAAANDLKVLVVELDESGALTFLLGQANHPDNDHGLGIAEAILGLREDFNLVRNVRPGLDLIPGGQQLALIRQILQNPDALSRVPGGSINHTFATKLAHLVAREDYDLVLLDCTNNLVELQEMALTASRYVLIPTPTKEISLQGLHKIGTLMKRVRAQNPLIRYIGVVLFAVKANATQRLRSTRERLGEELDEVPLLNTVIREGSGTAEDSESQSLLVRELAAVPPVSIDAENNISGAAFLAEQAARSRADAASRVANDFAQLIREVVEAIAAAEREPTTTTAEGA